MDEAKRFSLDVLFVCAKAQKMGIRNELFCKLIEKSWDQCAKHEDKESLILEIITKLMAFTLEQINEIGGDQNEREENHITAGAKGKKPRRNRKTDA